jgi:multiple sugar transport system permease protein
VNRRPGTDATRAVLSDLDWRTLRVRRNMFGVQSALLVALVVLALGPLLLLAKFAVTPTQDILRTPLAVFPNGVAWENLHAAWFDVHIGLYFTNTVVIAVGSWVAQIIIATTGGYVLSILRPRYARLLNAAVVGTLFIPGVVLLVPLYLTILDPPGPLGSLLNTYWAIWLPAAATAFNVVLVKRFFDNLPTEILEAARVDGAGPFRLVWYLVLPMSRPILGVVSVFAVIASWKDFLWPLLVLTRPDLQPLSVRLPTLQATTDLGTLMAGLAISTVIPILFFLVFQRLFLRGAGLSGAIKG